MTPYQENHDFRILFESSRLLEKLGYTHLAQELMRLAEKCRTP